MRGITFFRVNRVDIVLLGHFFGELFESDLFSVRDRMMTVLISSLSLLAAFGLLLPLMFNHKYHLLNAMQTPMLYQEAGRADKLMFICLSMGLTSLGTLLRWQTLFPSARDFLILGPLPLRRVQMFRAKLAALLLFISLLVVGVNLLPSLSLPAVMSGRWQLPHGSLLHVAALFLSCCLAGFFAFFSLLSLQGILMNVVPARWFGRCSLLLQVGLLMAMLAALPLVLWIPDLHSFMLSRPEAAHWFAPAWFLGWEEELLGVGDSFTAVLAGKARWASGFALLAAFALYAITYGRRIGQVLESKKTASVEGGPSLQSNMLHWMARSPSEAGVLSFVAKTLMRSGIHKLLLAAMGGVCFSLVIDSFVSLLVSQAVLHERLHYSELRHAALSAPLVVCFFLLCGLRYLFLLPVEARGNWVFRTSETRDTAAIAATEKTLLLFGILPVLLLTLGGMTMWLGLQPAAVQTSFVGLMSLVLLEAVLWNWDRIPFTCPYLPGKRNLIQSFLLFGLALSSFAYFATYVEVLFLDSAMKTAGMFGVLIVAVVFMRVRRKESWSAGIPLKFDDLPEPEVHTLGLQPE